MLPLPDKARAALNRLAQQSDCLLFGELHGTQEVPQVLAALLGDLTALGYGGLALEIPMAQQEALVRWASGASNAPPLFFAQPSSDGRGNEQVMALLRQVAEKGWQVLCFDANADQGHTNWKERDSVMAENLASQWKRCCPDRKVVGVCGNLHSRLTPPAGPHAELWPSFAACFQQRNPHAVVLTGAILFHSGSFFNGGVRTIQGAPLAEAEVREEAVAGHSFALHLPQATPATFLTPLST